VDAGPVDAGQRGAGQPEVQPLSTGPSGAGSASPPPAHPRPSPSPAQPEPTPARLNLPRLGSTGQVLLAVGGVLVVCLILLALMAGVGLLL